jgi:hypothetical protein
MRLAGGKRFVCNGANARHLLGNNVIGDAMDPFALCPTDLLRHFGLAS